jgi:hypothetical protein
MKNGKVYCLKDPITFEIKYIGFTRSTLSTRFSQHKHEALKKNTLSHCYNWFRKCVNNGKMPIIELLEDNISINKWGEREQYWINQYNNLTNQKNGGCGVHLNTNSCGRIRSIDAKKLTIIQLSLDGIYIKEWNSIIDAEKNLIGKYTGNIYRAIKTKSTALGFLWIFKQDYNNDKIYNFKGIHWKKVYLFCVYTKKLIKEYTTSIELSKDFCVSPSTITQAIKNNLIFKNIYFIRTDNDTKDSPKPNNIYEYNSNYYTSFNELYKCEKLPYSIGYQKQRKTSYLVKDITYEILQILKEKN